MDESQKKEERRPSPVDGRSIPRELEVDWPRATRPPEVEDFIMDPNETSIFRRFRF
jgi:hypothetical protein